MAFAAAFANSVVNAGNRPVSASANPVENGESLVALMPSCGCAVLASNVATVIASVLTSMGQQLQFREPASPEICDFDEFRASVDDIF